MATIDAVELKVTTNRPQDTATMVVSCEVEFTDFEVNSMNRLGLRYNLQCQLKDLDMPYADPVHSFDWQHFPSVPGGAIRHEHVVFEAVLATSNLHVYVVGREGLFATVTLTNAETGAEVTGRSKFVPLDLAT
jgi:hypothetical protein